MNSPFDQICWICSQLGLTDQDTDILQVVPGQPFKLNLWRRLASLWSDPDLALFDLLELGVPLGVNQALTPSSAWPRAEASC